MPKQAGAIVLIFGGVGLVYLAATGYLESAWNGIRGQCGGSGPTVSAGTGAADPPPAKAGDASGGRALGRGRGGQVSNVPYIDKGVYYPSASGALMASDSGVW